MLGNIFSYIIMSLFTVRQEHPKYFSRNKKAKNGFDFNQKCIFLIKNFHILTVSTLQNLSISLHHVSILVQLSLQNSWLLCVIQHRRRYCSVPLLLSNSKKKKNTENVLGYLHCIPDLSLMKVLENEVNCIWLVEHPQKPQLKFFSLLRQYIFLFVSSKVQASNF